MEAQNRNYLSLFLWITVPILIGWAIGVLTKPEINTWYNSLHRSALTPPNYIFPIAWTILYGIIGVCGWAIWGLCLLSCLRIIKSLYVIQLILNWSWVPLFFHYHLIDFSLMVLLTIDIAVGAIIYLGVRNARTVSLLMIPYFLWILFASYLNFFIWHYN